MYYIGVYISVLFTHSHSVFVFFCKKKNPFKKTGCVYVVVFLTHVFNDVCF